MKWFRHFSDASNSIKLNQIIDNLGVEGYGRYWLFLELLASHYDGSSLTFEIHFREISTKLHIKFSKKLETFMGKLVDFGLITYSRDGKVYKIGCPILRELQDKDSKYNRKRVVKPSYVTTLEEEVEVDKEVKGERERDFTSRASPIVLNKKLLDPSQVSNLWNNFFQPEIISKAIKAAPLTIGVGKTLNDFEISSGFLTTLDEWQELFVQAKKQKWLIGQPWFGFLWAIKHDNIMKVQQGMYEDQSEPESNPVSKKQQELESLPDCDICYNDGVIAIDRVSHRCRCERGKLKYPQLPEIRRK